MVYLPVEIYESICFRVDDLQTLNNLSLVCRASKNIIDKIKPSKLFLDLMYPAYYYNTYTAECFPKGRICSDENVLDFVNHRHIISTRTVSPLKIEHLLDETVICYNLWITDNEFITEFCFDNIDVADANCITILDEDGKDYIMYANEYPKVWHKNKYFSGVFPLLLLENTIMKVSFNNTIKSIPELVIQTYLEQGENKACEYIKSMSFDTFTLHNRNIYARSNSSFYNIYAFCIHADIQVLESIRSIKVKTEGALEIFKGNPQSLLTKKLPDYIRILDKTYSKKCLKVLENYDTENVLIVPFLGFKKGSRFNSFVVGEMRVYFDFVYDTFRKIEGQQISIETLCSQVGHTRRNSRFDFSF